MKNFSFCRLQCHLNSQKCGKQLLPMGAEERCSDKLFLLRVFFLQQTIKMFQKESFKLISEKQVIWKKYAYLQKSTNNVYFDCQCGKRYASFPAIFLHFQKKHNRKISINRLSEDFEVRKTQKETIYFYFAQSRSVDQEWGSFSNSSSQTLQQFFLKFLEEERSTLQSIIKISFLRKMLGKLEIFVKQWVQQDSAQKLQPRQLLQSIPLYFNEFIRLQQLNNELSQGQSFNALCLALLNFSKWLNRNSLSLLITQLNLQ